VNAATEPLPMTFDASDQVVDIAGDIAGDTAVIHGITTLMQNGKVLDRHTVHRRLRATERSLDGVGGPRDQTVDPALNHLGFFAHSQIQIEFAVYGHPSPAMLLDHGRKR
jgi:hypothetical protein